MQLWIHKVIAIVVTFVLPFFLTMLPYFIHGCIERRGAIGRKIISFLMCFGGGIFFGTFLLHMAPEARETLNTALWEPDGVTYPVTDLIIGVGLFSVLILEKCVMRINKRLVEKKQRKVEQNCMVFQASLEVYRKCEDGKVELRDVSEKRKNEVCDRCSEGKTCSGLITICPHVTESQRSSVSIEAETPTVEVQEDAILTENIKLGNGVKKSADVTNHIGCSNKIEPCSEEIHCCEEPREVETDLSSTFDISTNKETSEHHHHHKHHHHHHHHGHNHHDNDHNELDDLHHHEMRSMFLVFALSLHHLFEGISVGLQPNTTLLWTLMFAVMCHESVISFSVGISFARMKYTFKKHLIYALVLNIFEPVGEAIGTIISELESEGKALDIVSGFLQAFTAGVFLFVTFFEIFQTEIDEHGTSLGTVFSATFGFAVMALLMLIPEAPASSDNNDSTNTTEIMTEMMTEMMTTM